MDSTLIKLGWCAQVSAWLRIGLPYVGLEVSEGGWNVKAKLKVEVEDVGSGVQMRTTAMKPPTP
eukprot:836842-Amphidinium_carterae.1